LRLLLSLTQKLSVARDLLKSYLAAGENRSLTATGKPSEIATIEIFDETHGLRFLEESQSFLLISVKKKQTHCTAPMQNVWRLKTLKYNVRTTLQLVYHGCKNLTHTSKNVK